MATTPPAGPDDDALEELVMACLDAADPRGELLERTAGDADRQERALRLLEQVQRLEQLEPEAPAPAAPNPCADDPSTWPVIPGVQLEALLGRGGQGFVFRGRQTYLDRMVAVKVLDAELRTHAFVDRFRREARMLAGLSHPHVVTCHHAGVTDSGHCHMVMEFVEGPNLRAWIEQHGALPLTAALDLGIAMAQALEHAQRSGLIHRDVKSENVLLQPKADAPAGDSFPFVPRLADLGLARPLARRTGATLLTPVGAMIGTPATMAPEQFDDPERVDQRADVYGLGCVLHHALAGRPAFGARTITDLVLEKAAMRGTGLRVAIPGVPEPVCRFVARMLAADPADRPQDHATVGRELTGLREALAARAPRRRSRSALVLGMVVAGAATAIILTLQLGPTRPPQAPTPPAAPAMVPGSVLALFGADEATAMARWQCEDASRWQLAEDGKGVLANAPRGLTAAMTDLPGGSFALAGTIEPRFRYLSPEQPQVAVAAVRLELALATDARFVLELTPRAGAGAEFDAVLRHVQLDARGEEAAATELLRTGGAYPEAAPLHFVLAWDGRQLQAAWSHTAPPVAVGAALALDTLAAQPRLRVAVDRGVAVLRGWTLTGR